jgi:acetyl-CoA C-acetyltransferase
VLAAELGWDHGALAAKPPTVTGGMTFGGGPLNNYVLGALVVLAGRLRADPGSIGLSSSVSGMLTKVGFSLWSTRPSPGGRFAGAEVTAEVAAVDHPRPVDPAATGSAVVVSATVDHAGAAPRAVAVCEFDDGRRTIAESTRPEVCEVATDLSVVGRMVTVGPAGILSL